MTSLRLVDDLLHTFSCDESTIFSSISEPESDGEHVDEFGMYSSDEEDTEEISNLDSNEIKEEKREELIRRLLGMAHAYDTDESEYNATEQLIDGIARFVQRDIYGHRGFQRKHKGKLNAIARAILCGVYDDTHSLSVFRGMPYIVKYIYEWTNEFNLAHYRDAIKTRPFEFNVEPRFRSRFGVSESRFGALCSEAQSYFAMKYSSDPKDYPNWSVYGKYEDYWEWEESAEYEKWSRQYLHSAFEPIQYFARDKMASFNLEHFPEPTGIHVNMMPFVMDYSPELPDFLKGYEDMICTVSWHCFKEHGKVCYLTIDESFVDKENTQRRPGLHVETPGIVKVNGIGEVQYQKGNGGYDQSDDVCTSWGGGTDGDNGGREGGIYMSCTVDETCEIWNCTIEDPKAVGDLGDVEHLRKTMEGYGVHREYMRAGRLYWITDRTPHESLPMQKSGMRQFFRIVTSDLSLWYAQHSTPNPLGVVPDPEVTRIIYDSKF